MKDFLKSNWLALLVVVAVLLFFVFDGRSSIGCNRPRPIVDKETNTETRNEPQPPVYIPVYVPQLASSQPPVIIPPQYQASEDLAQLRAQYNQLLQKFLSINTYKDSIPLKDSAGNRVGVVNIEDKISENDLKARSPNYQLNFPHTITTNTITIREPYIPKTRFYTGVSAIGTTDAPYMNGGSFGLMMKNRKEHILSLNLGAQYINSKAQPFVQVGTYWQIGRK